jgi:hypothetical protein
LGPGGLASVSYLSSEAERLGRASAESRAGGWELRVIDIENSWSLRPDARRRIDLYYQTQVSLQGTGSEPLGLEPTFPVENRNSLACLPGNEKLSLLASEMPVLFRSDDPAAPADCDSRCSPSYKQLIRQRRSLGPPPLIRAFPASASVFSFAARLFPCTSEA